MWHPVNCALPIEDHKIRSSRRRRGKFEGNPPPTQKERKEKERKRKGRERKNIHWLAVFTMGSQRGGLSNLSIEFVVDDPGASGKEDRRTYIPVVIGIPDGWWCKRVQNPGISEAADDADSSVSLSLSSLNAWYIRHISREGARTKSGWITISMFWLSLQGGITNELLLLYFSHNKICETYYFRSLDWFPWPV